MTEKQNFNVTLLVALGSVSSVLVLVMVIGVQAWFYSEQQRELEDKRAGHFDRSLMQLRTEQDERLHTYRWIDESQQIAAIPIDRAMALTVERRRRPAED